MLGLGSTGPGGVADSTDQAATPDPAEHFQWAGERRGGSPQIALALPSIPTADIFRGAMPFLTAQFARVLLILLFPAIVLWLPRTMGTAK